jgi:hypothetical protein
MTARIGRGLWRGVYSSIVDHIAFKSRFDSRETPTLEERELPASWWR